MDLAVVPIKVKETSYILQFKTYFITFVVHKATAEEKINLEDKGGRR